MTADEYVEYLSSPHWLDVRRSAMERARRRCQVCNGTRLLQVHHRTYARIGRELPEDLTVLCDECHGTFHDANHDGWQPIRWTTVAEALLEKRVALNVQNQFCVTTTVGILMVTDWSEEWGRKYSISQHGKWPVGVVSKASFYPEQFTEVWVEDSWRGRVVNLENKERQIKIRLVLRSTPVVRSQAQRRAGRVTTPKQENYIRGLRTQLGLPLDAPISPNRDEAGEEIRQLIEARDGR